MNRSKKIFLVFAGIFLVIIVIIGYDITRRTTFPGQQEYSGKVQSDSVNSSIDSLEVSSK